MKTIEWNKISDQDVNLIGLSVERVKDVTATLDGVTTPGLIRDLAAYHLASPLRLDDLLKAPAHDLLHDVRGIYISLNRATGQPRACFTPRFIVGLTEEQEAEKLGYCLISLLGLSQDKNGMVVTMDGKKRPLGIGRIVRDIVEKKLYLED